jgi:mannose-6-phosphate isomerase-like protein (cupin superfamily)
MAYKSSPRPVFDGPAPIPYREVTRHIWGEPEAGLVDDWIYVSSDKIHQLVFGLPPGEGFRHSEAFRTVFAADEVLFVLQGTMVIANPENGEVHLVQTGESVFFQKDTWHHAWAWGDRELRVLEYFAPPPSTGSSGKYAQTRPYVSQPTYERRALIGQWPAAQGNALAAARIGVLREADRLWSLDATDPRVLTGIIASTDQLTAGSVRLSPGGRSGTLTHGGAAGLYVLSGRVNILIEDADISPVWFELHPQDGFYLPQGTRYRAFNMGGAPAEYLFGVAPHYHPAVP